MDASSGSKPPSELWKLWCSLIYTRKTVERVPKSWYDRIIPVLITTGVIMIFAGAMYAIDSENPGGPPPTYHETMFHKRIGSGIIIAGAVVATLGPAGLMVVKYRSRSSRRSE